MGAKYKHNLQLSWWWHSTGSERPQDKYLRPCLHRKRPQERVQYRCYSIDALKGIYVTATKKSPTLATLLRLLMYYIASSKYLATPLAYFGSIPCNAGLEGGKGTQREMLGSEGLRRSDGDDAALSYPSLSLLSVKATAGR